MTIKGCIVKHFLALLIASFSLSAQAQCIKTDYQELKEFNEKELGTKFCKDKRDFDFNAQLVKVKRTAAATRETLGDARGQLKLLEELEEADEDAKSCKSEMERTLRLLAQKKVDEATASAQCPSLLATIAAQ